MFTGIIEQTGTVSRIDRDGENLNIRIKAQFTHELQIDQSVAHNGCCLTVVEISEDEYMVTAIAETIRKTELAKWKPGTLVNLERCMVMNGRLDGHIVQGHVDTTAICVGKEDENGSWKFTFEYKESYITVEKGSIAVNGTSLTVVDSDNGKFSVCIIPYTYEHTNFRQINKGDQVNLEFDIIGKYVAKLISART